MSKPPANHATRNVLILIGTYASALLILKAGHMNIFVTALMPCLAFSYALIIKR